MIVDDENINLAILSQILSPEFDLVTAMNGQDALKRAEKNQPDLILLDIVMPDMSGFDVLRKLKSSGATKDIPVIIITGRNNADDEEKAFLLGAVDYMTKPFNNTIVMARVKTRLQMVRQTRTIDRMSMEDALTGLPNRHSFDNHMEMEWKRAIREKKPLSLLIVDIDRFKAYNDAYGNIQGDELLKAVATVFPKSVRRPADLSARINGEEFAVILPDTAWESALLIAENIRKTIKATILPTVDGKTHTFVTVSIGLVTKTPRVNDTISDFFNLADGSMYEAKRAGRDRIIGKVL
jgi:diguanylate cyclase (GGDEF)-like protein